MFNRQHKNKKLDNPVSIRNDLTENGLREDIEFTCTECNGTPDPNAQRLGLCAMGTDTSRYVCIKCRLAQKQKNKK